MKTSKPRPVSMMVPRSTDTFGPIGLPAQAQEAPEASTAKAPRKPSFEVRNRPDLYRGLTQDYALPPGDDSRRMFTKMAFADAPKVKARLFDVGLPLFTRAHQTLIDSLRDECARLHGHSEHLKNRAIEGAEQAKKLKGDNAALSSEVKRLRHKLSEVAAEHRSLSNDFARATEALAEVDSMFLDIRARRMSRFANQPVETPGVELGDPIEPIKRPKSPTPDSGHIL